MNFITSGLNPWNQSIPMHASWDLLWLSVLAGIAFFLVHGAYVRFLAKQQPDTAPLDAREFPERVPRHSLSARLFHWVMAAAMLALLFTGFLPVVGVKFAWVQWHWLAGIVLIASFLFHVVHASLWLDFWSIWPDRQDVSDARLRIIRALGRPSSPPPKPGKYPFENKLYHLTLVLVGFAVSITGVLMMMRVETPFFRRNPYALSDLSWGIVYVGHGMAGISLVALVMVHIYFAIRPEKWPITYSMIFGSMSRSHFVRHHDPERWKVARGGGKTAA